MTKYRVCFLSRGQEEMMIISTKTFHIRSIIIFSLKQQQINTIRLTGTNLAIRLFLKVSTNERKECELFVDSFLCIVSVQLLDCQPVLTLPRKAAM